MAENSAIEWTDATVNFWWGCTKVGPGCERCYAKTWAERLGFDIWGVGVPRREIKGAVKLIYRLQNGASWFYADNNRRRRVFVQSMSDLFDLDVPVEWFAVAWGCIIACDSLVVQIVTKRISAVEKRLAAIGATAWPQNAGLVISVVNQDEANRDVPRLLALKQKLGIPWVGLSMEPLLGPVDLTMLHYDGITNINALTGDHGIAIPMQGRGRGLDWIIVGGESGPGARPMHPDWARSLRDQCAAAGVPFLFKQHGEWISVPDLRRLEGGQGPGFGAFDHCRYDQEHEAVRVGKKAAGRLLDGVQHDGVPA